MSALRRRSRASRSGGFTLVETTIALTLLLVLGYAVTTSMQVARNSNSTVDRVATEDRALRAAADALIEDLRSTNAANVTLTSPAGQNGTLVLRVPIEVGGVVAWGVHERALGPTPAEQDRVGWSVRYRVVDVPLGNGAFDRELRREVLDAGGAVRADDTLMRNLRSGAADPVGFRVAAVGDVWEITLSTVGALAGRAGMRQVFHVRSRN